MDRFFCFILRLLTPQRLRYPWLIGAALWAAWILTMLLGKANTDLSGHLIGTDFAAFYTAGKIILLGKAASLYDLSLAHTIQQGLYPSSSPYFNPYLNPPFYGWLFVPFALIPYPYSPLLWIGLGFLGLYFSLRWLGVEKPLKAFGLALTWLPVFYAASFGQNAFLSLSLFSLTFVLLQKKRYAPAGLVFSLLLYKPQFLIGIGLLWLLEWRKYWKALLCLAIGCLAQVGLSFLFLPDASLEYIRYTMKVASNLMTVEGFPIWNAYSVQSFWLGLLHGQKLAAQILYAICVIPILWFFWKFWKSHRQETGLLYAAAVCLTLWITPYLMVYDWTLLLITAVLLWIYRPDKRQLWQAIFALTWVITLVSGVLTFAQTQFLPFAIQISIPFFLWILATIYQKVDSVKELHLEPSG